MLQRRWGTSCVILIDSVHTDSFKNLASTVQISTGQMMIKGSGHIFSRESLCLPIVGIGVPLSMRYVQGDNPDSNEMIMRARLVDDLHFPHSLSKGASKGID